MADGDFRSTTVQGRTIVPTDLALGADPNEADLSAAAKSDTWAQIIEMIFENPPATSALTAAHKLALRTLIQSPAAASAALTGTPTAPTAGPGTNSTQLATTEFVTAAIAAAVLMGGGDGVLASATLLATMTGTSAARDFTTGVLDATDGTVAFNGTDTADIDLSGADDGDAVATAVQNAINALTGVSGITVTYDTANTRFVLSGPRGGIGSGLGNTALALALGLDDSNAAVADTLILRMVLSTGTVLDVDLVTLLTGLITGVAAGSGLTGGGTAGDVTLALDPAPARTALGVHHYVIPNSGVGGNGNAITLSTGYGLNSLPQGAMIIWRPSAANSTSVTLAVDNIPAEPLWKGNGLNGFASMESGDLLASRIAVAIFEDDNFYFWGQGALGDAAMYDVGTQDGDLVPKSYVDARGAIRVSTAASYSDANTRFDITVPVNAADGDTVVFVVPTNYAPTSTLAIVARTYDGSTYGPNLDIDDGVGTVLRPQDFVAGQTVTMRRVGSAYHVATTPVGLARLAGAVFTGAVAGITPTDAAHFATKEYVDGLVNPDAGDHDRYFAHGDDATFVEADYTGGVVVATDTITIPTLQTAQYLAIAVPATSPITTITQLGAFEQDLTSFFTEGSLSIGGTNHQTWVSTMAFPTTYSGIQLRLS